MANKMGRPKVKDPATNQLRIRLSDNDLKKLNECCELTGKNKSDVIRTGIDLVLNQDIKK